MISVPIWAALSREPYWALASLWHLMFRRFLLQFVSMRFWQYFFCLVVGKNAWERLVMLLLGTAIGIVLSKLDGTILPTLTGGVVETVAKKIVYTNTYYVLGGMYILLGIVILIIRKKITPVIGPCCSGFT